MITVGPFPLKYSIIFIFNQGEEFHVEFRSEINSWDLCKHTYNAD